MRPSDERPIVADFSLGLSQMQQDGEKGHETRRPAAERNQHFKSTLCKHFTQRGECPFGDGCHYAHGENELSRSNTGGDVGAGVDGFFDETDLEVKITEDYFQPSAAIAIQQTMKSSHNLPPLPSIDKAPINAFVLILPNHHELSASFSSGSLLVDVSAGERVRKAKGRNDDQTVVFVSVFGSSAIQGVGKVENLPPLPSIDKAPINAFVLILPNHHELSASFSSGSLLVDVSAGERVRKAKGRNDDQTVVFVSVFGSSAIQGVGKVESVGPAPNGEQGFEPVEVFIKVLRTFELPIARVIEKSPEFFMPTVLKDVIGVGDNNENDNDNDNDNEKESKEKEKEKGGPPKTTMSSIAGATSAAIVELIDKDCLLLRPYEPWTEGEVELIHQAEVAEVSRPSQQHKIQI